MDVDLTQVLSVPGLIGLLTAFGMAVGAVNVWRKTNHSKERDVIQDRNSWQRSLIDRAEYAEALYLWERAERAKLLFIVRSELGPEKVPPEDPRPPRPKEPEEVERNGRAPRRTAAADAAAADDQL